MTDIEKLTALCGKLMDGAKSPQRITAGHGQSDDVVTLTVDEARTLAALVATMIVTLEREHQP